MLPTGTDNLIQFSGQIMSGLRAHGRWIGLGGHSLDDLRLKVEQLQQAVASVATTRNTKLQATQRLALADKALRAWLEKSRLVVMLACGPKWSSSWIPTGFTNRTTKVPRTLDQRIALARSLVTFFARHPEFGVNFADITAARGRAVYERVLQSSQILHMAKDDADLASDHRSSVENDLRNGLRRLIAALKVQMEEGDPRWT